MVGIYFSGTGNSKYCAEKFLEAYDKGAKVFSIEQEEAVKSILENEEIVLSYPVQYSQIPKILKDFIHNNKTIWQGKKIFVIATMGLFCGDGAGIMARMLKAQGAVITGGLHVRMPDSICDEKVLKRSIEDNRKLVLEAERKVRLAAEALKSGRPTREGLSPLCRFMGFFGQRLYFGWKTNKYSDRLKIDADVCAGCGKCAKLCPMNNIVMENAKAVAKNKCTMCYRCVNKCPKQAITLLGKQVTKQGSIEKYL